jgi:hypothetical protein
VLRFKLCTVFTLVAAGRYLWYAYLMCGTQVPSLNCRQLKLYWLPRMLHELLFSLLGFVGDVIIDDGHTYRVKDGFDLLRESEKDLVNRISPLGWYYVRLTDTVQKYDVSWANVERNRVYMASAVQGVSDLLAEYVADVAFIEQLILSDGPMPLSQVLQHLQKVMRSKALMS